MQTVDFFTPIVDDARAWGRIAAANALSDIYAMGATPVTALNLVGWPRKLGFELLGEVLEGAGEIAQEAGVVIVGGHSIDDQEPKFGMAVTGTVRPSEIVRTAGAAAGSVLVLTKPLGMGVISSGIKEGVTSNETARRAIEIMSALNNQASTAMVEVGVQAATDVTGFGLVGHLLEMLGDGLDAAIDLESVPLLAEAIDLAERGVWSGGSERNRAAGLASVELSAPDDPRVPLLFDAQTSGGLLIAVAPERAAALLDALSARKVEGAARIGTLAKGSGKVQCR